MNKRRRPFIQARDATDPDPELLRQIVVSEPKDFQARTELANVHLLQKDFADAQVEYLHAIDAHPGYFLALFNFGRLESTIKNYDVAIEALAKAVEYDPNRQMQITFTARHIYKLRKAQLRSAT